MNAKLKKKPALTPKERATKSREKRRGEGFVFRQVQFDPDTNDAVNQLAEELNLTVRAGRLSTNRATTVAIRFAVAHIKQTREWFAQQVEDAERETRKKRGAASQLKLDLIHKIKNPGPSGRKKRS